MKEERVMFNKKNKKHQPEVEETFDEEVIDPTLLDVDLEDIESIKKFYAGARTLKDYIAPPAFYRGDETYMMVGDKFVRSFTFKGFPKQVRIGWLDDLIDYDGDMDTAFHIEPTDERAALDELTNKIVQAEADLMMEHQKGSVVNVTRLETKIRELYQERSLLEQNYQSQYQISISSNLYADDLKDLRVRSEKLDNKLKGQHMYHAINVLRQDDGYKSAIPVGRNYLMDTYRNFNTGSVVACFPFYNAEMIHPNGVYLGINQSTGSPIFIDLFDRDFVENSNATIFGASGSGKTVTASAFLFRNTLRGTRSVVVDPEGEWVNLTHDLDGVVVELSPQSKMCINVFDIEEEDEIDGTLKATGKKLVDVKGKVSDILNLIGVMAGHLDPEIRSIVSFVIAELYEERGINENPESLYIEGSLFNEETQEFYFADVKKEMPTFSDFHNKLEKKANELNHPLLKQLANTLLIFKKGGLYDMFDCKTSDELMFMKDAPIITFNVSKLEDSVLRPIGMYVALNYAWERFGKKLPDFNKFIICDEAWMLTSKHMQGYQYTSSMLEKIARRARKRRLGLLVVSQKFDEFNSSDEGRAVLSNCALNMYLKSKPEDLDAIQSMFKISDGERQFLEKARKGEVLIRTSTQVATAKTHILQSEYNLLIERRLRERKTEERDEFDIFDEEE